jgi:hypothetical protein
MASSKLFDEVALISDTLATDITSSPYDRFMNVPLPASTFRTSLASRN